MTQNLQFQINAEAFCDIQLNFRASEKYFDIGMVRDNQLGIMGTFWQNISFYLQAYFYHYLFCSLENIK